jgi:protein TonB
VYPETARAAEIEADVLLELVVDGEGRVTGARPLAARDLGLTDAALRAVRAYRFTPAERAGRPVRVRMRWTVTFRLQ